MDTVLLLETIVRFYSCTSYTCEKDVCLPRMRATSLSRLL
jgi:hypothetical protein